MILTGDLQLKQPERYDPLGSYMNGCTTNKNNFGVEHTKIKHAEIDKKISEAIQRSNQSEKHEASTLRVDVVHFKLYF